MVEPVSRAQPRKVFSVYVAISLFLSKPGLKFPIVSRITKHGPSLRGIECPVRLCVKGHWNSRGEARTQVIIRMVNQTTQSSLPFPKLFSNQSENAIANDWISGRGPVATHSANDTGTDFRDQNRQQEHSDPVKLGHRYQLHYRVLAGGQTVR
jgi:hypothetical protein